MPYTRKTVDRWDIEQQTAEGWEVVNSETTRPDARRSLREYRENQPEMPARVVKRRERIAPTVAA